MKQELINYNLGLGGNNVISNWIEKRVLEPINIGKVEHIIDFLIHKQYKKLDRATYEQMETMADKWNKTLQKKGAKIKVSNKDLETILDFGDGFKIVKLIGENEYKREGHLMSHCVASYYGKDTEIYSLRDKDNMPHCTIEKDKQIKGKGNGEIHPKYIDYVVKFLEYSGMEVRDNEMENLGYKVPYFIKYCTNKLYKDRYVRANETVTYNDKIEIFDDWNKLLKYKGNKVKGYNSGLYLNNTPIKSLPDNLNLGGYLYLKNTSITSLPDNLSVGGGLYLNNTPIKSLPDNLSVCGNLDLRNTKIKSLPDNLSVGGWLDLNNTKIKSLPDNLSVGDYLDLSDTPITSLPDNLNVGGYLDLSDTPVTSLPDNLNVSDSLHLRNTKIMSLPDNLSVGGGLYLSNTPIKSLPDNLSVGGSLDLSDTPITSLPDNLNVGGWLDLRNTKIKSLPDNLNVGGWLDLRNTQISKDYKHKLSNKFIF